MVRGLAILVTALGLVACAQDEGYEQPNLSLTTFEDEVYPVLIRDCGFQTCHGSAERFFRIWGPGRDRLLSTSNPFDPVTDQEIELSYRRTVAMVDAKSPADSILLKKPLSVAAGGAGHLGADRFGRNVYRTQDDPGYLALSRWVFSLQP